MSFGGGGGTLMSSIIPHSSRCRNNLLQFRGWGHLCTGTMTSTGGFCRAMVCICMKGKGGETILTHHCPQCFCWDCPVRILDHRSMTFPIRISTCLSHHILPWPSNLLYLEFFLFSFIDNLLQNLSSLCLHFFPSQSPCIIQHMLTWILFFQPTHIVLLSSSEGFMWLNPIDAFLFTPPDFSASRNFQLSFSCFFFCPFDDIYNSSLSFLSSPWFCHLQIFTLQQVYQFYFQTLQVKFINFSIPLLTPWHKLPLSLTWISETASSLVSMLPHLPPTFTSTKQSKWSSKTTNTSNYGIPFTKTFQWLHVVAAWQSKPFAWPYLISALHANGRQSRVFPHLTLGLGTHRSLCCKGSFSSSCPAMPFSFFMSQFIWHFFNEPPLESQFQIQASFQRLC